MNAMSNPADPFSASVIPFEVPEQMRAFAEKGVSQARDSYAKLKDIAESHNSTMEAVFASASKGASEYSAKLLEMTNDNEKKRRSRCTQRKNDVHRTRRGGGAGAPPRAKKANGRGVVQPSGLID